MRRCSRVITALRRISESQCLSVRLHCCAVSPGRGPGQERRRLPPPSPHHQGGAASKGHEEGREHTGISEARDSGTALEALIREGETEKLEGKLPHIFIPSGYKDVGGFGGVLGLGAGGRQSS